MIAHLRVSGCAIRSGKVAKLKPARHSSSRLPGADSGNQGAGGAWAAVLMSAVTAAIAIGHVGHEGAATGGLFSLLAIATLARIALVAGQLNKDPGVSAMLVWLPGVAWVGAGLLLLVLALRWRGLAKA